MVLVILHLMEHSQLPPLLVINNSNIQLLMLMVRHIQQVILQVIPHRTINLPRFQRNDLQSNHTSIVVK